jgi:hypothetical protein
MTPVGAMVFEFLFSVDEPSARDGRSAYEVERLRSRWNLVRIPALAVAGWMETARRRLIPVCVLAPFARLHF